MNKYHRSAKEIAAIGLAIITTMSSVSAFAASTNVNSLASVNSTDDGISVGYDVSQKQKTSYQTSDDDSALTTDVYATQASTFTATVPEVIILDGKYNSEGKNSGTYEVDVTGNIAASETVTVRPDESLTLGSVNKEDITATVDQSKDVFTYESGVKVDNIDTATGTVTAEGMTAGQWHGSFDFDINLLDKEKDFKVIEEGQCGENVFYQMLAPALAPDSVSTYSLEDEEEGVNPYEGYDVENCILRIYGEGSTYDYIKYVEASPWYKYRKETNIDYENRKILNPDGTDYGVSYDKYLTDNPNGIHYTSIEIEQGVTRIGDWCFYRCTADELVIPEGITEIGNFGIRYSPALKKVSLPSTLKNIDDFGISRNQVLEEVDIKEGLETVGQNGFASNPMLKSVKLPKTCTSIGVTQHPSGYTYTGVSVQNIGTFVGCKALETIDFGSVVEIDNICCSGIAATNIVIPNTVKKIGDNAFIKCPNLETVVFEKDSQCTSIGKAAFSECTNLKSVVGGTSLETFGASVFNKCTSLTTFEFSPTNKSVPSFYSYPITKVVLNSNVTSLGTTVAQCKQLKELYFTTNITEITNSNLAGCSALTDIYYTGTEEEFNAITITGASAIPTVNKATKHFNVPEADFYK